MRKRKDGAKRLLDMRASYSDEVQNRFVRQFRDIAPLGASADYHLRDGREYYRLMEIARAIARKDDIVGQGVRRLVSNIMQQGPVLNTATGVESLDAYLRDKWAQWASDADQCDASRQSDLLAMAYQVLEGSIVDGDIWALLTRDGGIQLIEAHRVRSPVNKTDNTFLGVTLNAMREQQAIYVAIEPVVPDYAYNESQALVKLPVRAQSGRRQVLHFALRRRPGQTRGVTALAPILSTITQHGDLQFAQLIKAQSAAAYAILHEYEQGVDVPSADATMGDSSATSYSDGIIEEMELGPAMEYFGVPGERLSGFSPNIPNSEFFPHTKLIMTFIAVNLDMPLNLLLLDPSDTNFSGWRGATDQAQRAWAYKQRQIIKGWYSPIYSWKVDQWAKTDPYVKRFAELPTLLRHEFNPPYWPYIEPLKDAQGDALIVERRLNSRRKLLARRGLDIEEVDRENLEDQARLFRMAMQATEDISAQYPWANLDWRELLNGPQATASAPALVREEADGEDDDEQQ